MTIPTISLTTILTERGGLCKCLCLEPQSYSFQLRVAISWNKSIHIDPLVPYTFSSSDRQQMSSPGEAVVLPDLFPYP